jgi:hypothetical protein
MAIEVEPLKDARIFVNSNGEVEFDGWSIKNDTEKEITLNEAALAVIEWLRVQVLKG